MSNKVTFGVQSIRWQLAFGVEHLVAKKYSGSEGQTSYEGSKHFH